MPLAIYREVAAHLRQVMGVKVELLEQSSSTFAYWQSQIEGLSIAYADNSDRQQQIEAILTYYAERHGNWERMTLDADSPMV